MQLRKVKDLTRADMAKRGTLTDYMVLLSEGNPGAAVAMTQLIEALPKVSDEDNTDFFAKYLTLLDDMNLRGSQIHVAYKNFFKQDAEAMLKMFATPGKAAEVVEFVNSKHNYDGGQIAVPHGALTNPRWKWQQIEEEVAVDD